MIAKKPVIEPPVMECTEIPLPSVMLPFETPNLIEFQSVNPDFILALPQCLSSIDNVVIGKLNQLDLASLNEADGYIHTLSKKLLFRLQSYMASKLPTQKDDIKLNIHWVWQSFKQKVRMIATLMIVGGHVVDKDLLKHTTAYESLLSSQSNFERVTTMNVDKELRGTYLLLDCKRNVPVYIGIALKTFDKVWEQLSLQAMLEDYSNRKKKICMAYPNVDTTMLTPNLSLTIRGLFQDLAMLDGVSIKMDKIEEFVTLFK